MICRTKSWAGIAALSVVLLGVAPVEKTPAPVDRFYTAWAKFVPGSSVSFTTESPLLVPKDDKSTVGSELVSVTDEKVELNVVYNGEAAKPAIPGFIKSAGTTTIFTDAGTKDITAAGKTFKCQVVKFVNDGDNMDRADPQYKSGTLYLNDEVPGAIVKMESVMNGQPYNVTLAAYVVK